MHGDAENSYSFCNFSIEHETAYESSRKGMKNSSAYTTPLAPLNNLREEHIMSLLPMQGSAILIKIKISAKIKKMAIFSLFGFKNSFQSVLNLFEALFASGVAYFFE